MQELSVQSMTQHILPNHHLNHLAYLNEMTDWLIVGRLLSAALFVVWVYRMELPSFQDPSFLY